MEIFFDSAIPFAWTMTKVHAAEAAALCVLALSTADYRNRHRLSAGVAWFAAVGLAAMLACALLIGADLAVSYATR